MGKAGFLCGVTDPTQNVHVYLASLVTPAEAGFTGQEKDDKRSAEAGSTF